MKYVIVTGGVLSGLGKGITTSSIGRQMKERAYNVTAVKIDPYLNCDAGTMNPYQHGEVYVLNDGGEVDLDLGNYERFLDTNLGSDHNITTGKVYKAVIEKERRGDYLGKTVQIIPHITNEIKDRIKKVAKDTGADIVLVELGGTVGDIESMPFLEAVRQLHREVGGDENCIFVHTTLVPFIGVVGEQKTKPTQHSVKELRSIGIQPHIIVARAERPLEYDIKRKISLFCNVPLEAVFSAPDAKSIYQVPILFEEQGMAGYILKRLKLDEKEERKADYSDWNRFVSRLLNPREEVNIAIIGKYTGLADSYMSHTEALNHAASRAEVKVNKLWVEAEDIETSGGHPAFEKAHGILVPGGFGDRGTEGKVLAAKYVRENKIPFLGICLGFQLATIEFARSVLVLEGANSSEFDEDCPHPVVDLLPEQKDIKDMGATMRLGAHKVKVKEGSRAHGLYGKTEISERHRHRYEINPDYIERIENAGLEYTGKSIDGRRMEIGELRDHPYFIISQFHPEFNSRPLRPSPLHYGLVLAAAERKNR